MVTTRQRKLLNLLVADYISSATPVGSSSIVRNHDVGVSSATVRNDLGVLEEEGYVTRPHPSAGSVPADKAYRLYVESLVPLDPESIPQLTRETVRARLTEAERDVDSWAAAAAEVLAELAGNMAVATFPKAKESRIHHFELVRLQELTVLVIVVLEQARLRKQLIRLQEPIFQDDLDAAATRIKGQILGLTRREIQAAEHGAWLSPFEEELVGATAHILDAEDKAAYREHYVDGLRNLFSQPEFSESDSVRSVVEGVEDGTLVHAIVEQSPEEPVVKVFIGHENQGDVLRPFSVVVCQYGVPGQALGVVSAVGPTRMEYSRTIKGVAFLSSVMSELTQGVTDS